MLFIFLLAFVLTSFCESAPYYITHTFLLQILCNYNGAVLSDNTYNNNNLVYRFFAKTNSCDHDYVGEVLRENEMKD